MVLKIQVDYANSELNPEHHFDVLILGCHEIYITEGAEGQMSGTNQSEAINTGIRNLNEVTGKLLEVLSCDLSEEGFLKICCLQNEPAHSSSLTIFFYATDFMIQNNNSRKTDTIELKEICKGYWENN